VSQALHDHMCATLVPSEATCAAVAALAGDGARVADNPEIVAYSILAIKAPTFGQNVSHCWAGDETAFDPGTLYSTRSEALDACKAWVDDQGADGAAYVTHRANGDVAAWIY
jgi:hypothetical protein